MAAVVATNIGYLLLTFLPPILWLLFYLHQDRRPEPKILLILTFIGGAASAILALLVEMVLLGREGIAPDQLNLQTNAFAFFLVIGLAEEYSKYLAVKFLILKRPDFDEPVDAMIYLITAALGFAALENALFLFPIFQQSVFAGLEVATNRFLGANLLHALSSAVVGFFLAKKFLSPHRHHFIAAGVIIASLLHAVFNYLILVRGTLEQGTFYIVLFLALMAVMVFVEFERLKKSKVNIVQKL